MISLALLATVVLSSFNSTHAAKPDIDCSKIRGVCYGIVNDEEQVRRELGYGSRVQLNAVRFWLSRVAYERQGEKYIQQIVDFVRICDECGYKSMPILFNGNMLNPKTIEPGDYEASDAYAIAVPDPGGVDVGDGADAPGAGVHAAAQVEEDLSVGAGFTGDEKERIVAPREGEQVLMPVCDLGADGVMDRHAGG